MFVLIAEPPGLTPGAGASEIRFDAIDSYERHEDRLTIIPSGQHSAAQVVDEAMHLIEILDGTKADLLPVSEIVLDVLRRS